MSSSADQVLGKIHQVRGLLASLLEEDFDQLLPAAKVQVLQALRPGVCQVQALQHRLVGAVDAQGTARTPGSASTATWLRNALHVSDAVGLVRSAAALSRLPKAAAAFAAGEISDAHVSAIAKVAAMVPADVLAAGTEELLVDQARVLAPSKFTAVAARIRDQAVPAVKPRPPDPQPRRWLRTQSRANGEVSLSGIFDVDGGRLLLSALAAATAPRRPGDQVVWVTRRADALIELCRRANSADDQRPAEPIASVPERARPSDVCMSSPVQLGPANGALRARASRRGAEGASPARRERPGRRRSSPAGEAATPLKPAGLRCEPVGSDVDPHVGAPTLGVQNNEAGAGTATNPGDPRSLEADAPAKGSRTHDGQRRSKKPHKADHPRRHHRLTPNKRR